MGATACRTHGPELKETLIYSRVRARVDFGSLARRGAGSVAVATGLATQHRQGPKSAEPQGVGVAFPPIAVLRCLTAE